MTSSTLTAERWLYTGLVASTTALATVRFCNVLRVDGLTPLKLLLLTLFASLFAWIAASFWLAALGCALRCIRLRNKQQADELPLASREIARRRSRTAIVMPIHNEQANEVFSRIEVMRESLAGPQAADIDFYVLSDSTQSQCWIAEEIEWDRLRRERGPLPALYYRHRLRNDAKKSGNIREFCENWGALYAYMIVLDADSVMTGPAFIEMIRRMDENPRTALIQVPPALVGRHSLFARIQQFASSVYGPLFWEGLAHLQGPDGNYWGHNAIIRVQPFMQNCGLPKLKGNGPLGGEILSHDFVEAAMLRRAGWEVCMAPDLSGSYEEPPPSLLDHVKRDRRWCEGNLQHIKLIFARGFRTASRMHLAMGVMSYLSAPIWLCMIVASVFETCAQD
jgi:membrane glycosyltransferase